MIFLFLLVAIVIIFLKIKSPQIKGVIGERNVALKLSFLDGTKYKVLNDVMLQNKSGRTSQIDHVVVFTGSATLKEIESSVPVIYSNQLNSTIRNLSVLPCLSDAEVDKIIEVLSVKKYGDFYGCSNYPRCRFTMKC